MSLEDGVLDDGLLVEGDAAGVDHVVEHELAHGVQVVGGHVEADGAVDDEGAQLEQRVQRQRRHVRLRPPVAALLQCNSKRWSRGGLIFLVEFTPGHANTKWKGGKSTTSRLCVYSFSSSSCNFFLAWQQSTSPTASGTAKKTFNRTLGLT